MNPLNATDSTVTDSSLLRSPLWTERGRGLLVIRPDRCQMLPLPHYLLINGQLLGLMRGNDDVRVVLPQGDYVVTIRSAYKFIESSATLHIDEGTVTTVAWGDRERWWNWLFNIDLVLWTVKRFIDFGTPWDTVYEVVSNGFFALWLLRIWLIRKHYFKLTINHSLRYSRKNTDKNRFAHSCNLEKS